MACALQRLAVGVAVAWCSLGEGRGYFSPCCQDEAVRHRLGKGCPEERFLSVRDSHVMLEGVFKYGKSLGKAKEQCWVEGLQGHIYPLQRPQPSTPLLGSSAVVHNVSASSSLHCQLDALVLQLSLQLTSWLEQATEESSWPGLARNGGGGAMSRRNGVAASNPSWEHLWGLASGSVCLGGLEAKAQEPWGRARGRGRGVVCVWPGGHWGD